MEKECSSAFQYLGTMIPSPNIRNVRVCVYAWYYLPIFKIVFFDSVLSFWNFSLIDWKMTFRFVSPSVVGGSCASESISGRM